jgi:hypothetical protein
MSRSQRFGQLAVCFTFLGTMSRVLLPGLVAVPASGCLCDCAGTFNQLRVVGSSSMTKLDVAGDACGETLCTRPDPDLLSACKEFTVKLIGRGSCHLAATASDGNQSSTDVTVTFLHEDCCGNYYTTGPINPATGHGSDTVEFTF